ncbi:FAD/NAD(P)-binding domain-containing protein [Xylariaceae sp. FL1272]|nr:FAD/NAD(P)-binding domain-containing protein [Xylariaceae sp. FL1272]
MSSTEGFKVIVVGGGPVGLTAAHALTEAGIDFIMLEGREEAVTKAGSHIVLSAIGLHALAGIGLGDAINNVSTDLPELRRINDKGQDIGTLNFFEWQKRDFGTYPKVISRYDLTRTLYESLPTEAQAKILTGKRVSNIKSEGEGVKVTCKDGTVYTGSLVIGADGAHSVVRQHMRSLALEAGSDEINEEKPFLTTYRCICIQFPTSLSDGIHPGLATETHSKGACTQLFVGEENAVCGIYETMKAPTRDRIRYTQDDQDAIVDRVGHLPLIQGGRLTIRDAYENKVDSLMVSLEEGVVGHWSYDGRIVLAGDAAHKFTPITGAGCNNGMADVVALANEMHKAFRGAAANPAEGRAIPSRAQLASAFKDYQEKRFDEVTEQCARAGGVTATSTWTTGVHSFIDRHVLGYKLFQRYLYGRAKVPEQLSFYFQDEKAAAAVASVA